MYRDFFCQNRTKDSNSLLANTLLKNIYSSARSYEHFVTLLKIQAQKIINKNPEVDKFVNDKTGNLNAYTTLRSCDIAALRIIDYIEYEGQRFVDLNLRGKSISSSPILHLWRELNGRRNMHHDLREDMQRLFKQLTESKPMQLPSAQQIEEWTERHPSGLDDDMIALREKNKAHIISVLIKHMDAGKITSERYAFPAGSTQREKTVLMYQWWNEKVFHLRFAVRNLDLLSDILELSADSEIYQRFKAGEDKGIPIFINPYYLSLIRRPGSIGSPYSDLSIRQYIFISESLLEEFGDIVAWEKEDTVKPGEPNAAGWILPTAHNLHRRYPEVAILIPDTVGRACGGLCVSCQRMYDFQRGNLNFNLERLKPKRTWNEKLKELTQYFRDDTQLRDILITGGDALMSNDKSLRNILEAVYDMALAKKEDNNKRAQGEKYAEMMRVRLGTRLPVYLPQRVTPSLVDILKEFKKKASKIGIKQFIIQTHFVSAAEVTPEAAKAIEMLRSAGWIITNQMVLTAAASRRGHAAKLRKVLNDIGVLTYYTFSVKGYAENSESFATNARSMQEQTEEKRLGLVSSDDYDKIRQLAVNSEIMQEGINELRERNQLPFLATDRSVLNLPGVGKSQSYRVIGITDDGRRILKFAYDKSRAHSPVVDHANELTVIESKSTAAYLRQLQSYGERVEDYESIWNYTLGYTEPRHTVFEYPKYDFDITDHYTHIDRDLL